MYLHLGKGRIVNTEEIIGIFDLDITSQSHVTSQVLVWLVAPSLHSSHQNHFSIYVHNVCLSVW